MYLSDLNNDEAQLVRDITAVLFVASEGISVEELTKVFEISTKTARKILQSLSQYFSDNLPLEITELAGRWYMSTSKDAAPALTKYYKLDDTNRIKLTRASMETLAIVAYNQPVTRSEIEEIRGVRSEKVVETLLGFGLIKIVGRKKSSGSPLLYRTTDKFLETLGLANIGDLPTIAEIEELKSSE